MERKASHRYLPVAYLGASLVLLAALLPTVLRPPQPPPPSSAEFSPDAPPDENSEVLLSELSRGRSTTAGAGQGIGEEGEETVAGTVTESLPPRGRCFGEPPRQIESLYSPPCRPAFVGDNGGATARGVTRDEIRIAFLMGLVGNAGRDGEIPAEPEPDESAVIRTYRVLREYFQRNMELYNRKLRFFYVTSERDENNPAQERAAARRAVEEYGVFAAINETSVAVFDELTRRGVLTFTFNQANRSFFEKRAPYGYSATPDSTGIIEVAAEYVCKQLHGKPPMFADDPSFNQNAPRKFGILSYQESGGYTENAPLLRNLVKEQCGAEIAETVEYSLFDGADSQSQISAAIARLKAAGVTTILGMQDFITNVFFTQAADQAKYFPEWFVTGIAGIDTVDFFFQQYSPTQWRNAFGITMYEIPARAQDRECNRAYKSIDPDNDPDGNMCLFLWWQLVQLMSALQLSGPELTAQNVQRGLWAWGRHPPLPEWRMAGGFGPGDYTYPDFAAEFWYDPTAIHPNGRPGAYRYIRGGKRFQRGTVPTDPSPLFVDRGLTTQPRGGS